MKLNYIPLFAILFIGIIFISGCVQQTEIPKTTQQEVTTQPSETPAPTLIYHGVTTHSWSNLITPGIGQADAIKSEVDAYEVAVGHTVAWVAFGDEWNSDGRTFPAAIATSIKNRGATPLIFLNLRSVDTGQVDSPYNLDAIISGKFDSDFVAWADGAKNFRSELIVDWGWEMNGDFTPWSGAHNGGDIEGPRNFQKAYRHIIELMRSRGANNIRWAFHINFPESPNESWNAFEKYYPGDDLIDVIGVSIYSAQFPTDDFFPSFESLMNPAYSRLNQMAPAKPVYVFEFGAAAGNPLGSSVTWADDALSGILSGRWPAIRGFAWWNDYWSQDDNPAHDTEMRVEKLPGLAKVFQSRLAEFNNLGDRPPIFMDKSLSKLSVSGNRIVTEGGQEIRLRGVNFEDPFLMEKDDINGDGVPDLHVSKKIAEDLARVKALGANTVRLAIWPGYYRLVSGESYLTNYVDRIVDLAEENGLYIIISYMAIGRSGGWYDSGSDATLLNYPAKLAYTDSDMAVAFWNTVAVRYGKRKHVLFEIYNEPADETTKFTWADWRPMGELLIATIRQHSSNIVLGSGPEYTSDLSDVSKNPYSDSNLVYVAHIYPNLVAKGDDQVSEWERRFGFLAKTYPVIVSEWGFQNDGVSEVTNGTLEGYGRPLLDYLDQKNIHWIAFQYVPSNIWSPAIVESDWTTLTEFGKFVKERLAQ